MTLASTDTLLSWIDIVLCVIDIVIVGFLIFRGRVAEKKPVHRSRLRRSRLRQRVYSRDSLSRIVQ